MRKREFETERGTLRYWVSENGEEMAQLVFPQMQNRPRVRDTRPAGCALLKAKLKPEQLG